MANVDYTPSVTAANLVAQNAAMQAQLWDKVLEVFEQNSDFYINMEGSGQDAIIRTRTDTAAGRGQKINFRVKAGFYAEPHLGDTLFETTADFEQMTVNAYELEVDYLRHGVSYTERTEEFLGLRGELVSGIPEELGNWLGRQKTEKLDMMFLYQTPAQNTIFANGKTLDTLVYTDTLTFVEIVQMRTQLNRLGGKPAKIGRDASGNPIMRNVVVATTDALYSLENDADFKDALKTTRDEAAAKTLFDGGWTDVRGNVIKERRVIDHDGTGPIGSALNPKALTGAAITSGSTTFAVLGGGSAAAAASTTLMFFKFFPNFAYQFLPDTTLSQDALTHYFLVINPPNAPTDPNKIGMYSYTTGNNGNQITIVKRLGPNNAGAQASTLGSVTWNTGVWSGVHTNVHPIGATILPCNAKGQPFGYSLMLMRGAAYRGYGKDRNKRSVQEFEGGFVKQIFIQSIFGQTPRLDAQLRAPGVLVLCHALTYAGLPVPTVT